jgi:hypothetical protein
MKGNKGICARYEKKLVNNRYYGAIMSESNSDNSLTRVDIGVTTQRECGSRFGIGDTVYASVDSQTIKQFKVTGIFKTDSKPEIWYRLKPLQFLPENCVFKTEFECRNNLIRNYNGN